MIALVLAATLAAGAPQPGDMTRNILTSVCLPYVNGEVEGAAALELPGFVETPATRDDTRNFQSSDEAYLLRLTTQGSAEEGDLNRVCVIQVRRGSLGRARSSVAPVMRQQGFTAEANLPADRPIWTSGGVTVSLRQNPGAATLVRVTFSTLDAEGT